MLTRLALVTLMLLGMTCPLAAQEWATKMFKATKHDFGTVARGSKATFEFKYENIYEEDFHISEVRSSCGCTTPKISKNSLKTWETGAIIAEFNTQAFLGYKTATITVVIDKPFSAEVQLEVEGNIRGDIAINPGSVDFGSTEQGVPVQKALNISHVGSSDWQIVDVRAESGIYEVELNEKLRRSGRAEYEMQVRLKGSAPAGYLQDQLTIVTNDEDNKTISIPVTGIVKSPITINPGSLTMGIVAAKQSVTKYLIVRAKKPFRITKVRCDDQSFDVQPSTESKTLHRVPVVFNADGEPRKIVQAIMFETDLAEGATAKCLATATVQ